MPVVSRNRPRLRNSRAGNAFAAREIKVEEKSGPHMQRQRRRAFDSTSKERRVSAGGHDFAFCTRRISQSAEVRASQALWNRIKLAGCCPRTLGISLALGNARWKLN